MAERRKEYLRDVDELAPSQPTAEGRGCREILERNVTAWRESKVLVIKAAQSGNSAEAVFHQQVEPNGREMRSTRSIILTYREQRKAQIDEQLAADIARTGFLLLVFAVVWLAVSLAFGS